MAKLVQLTNSETNENIYAKTPVKAIVNSDGSNMSTVNGILKGDGNGNISAADVIEVELVSLPNICNPNLLDNWYFGNPVNQRGQTEWLSSASVNVPCVDRWNWWGAVCSWFNLEAVERRTATHRTNRSRGTLSGHLSEY